MQNPIERQRSLKKLHFCIASYNPSVEQKAALITAQQDLKDKIEYKFRKSPSNQTYTFPRKQTMKEQYSDSLQIINLHHPIVNPSSENQPKPKPKIKLAKGKGQKRMQTQHYDREQNFHFKIDDRKFKYKSKPLCEINANNTSMTINFIQPIKQRIKTDYPRQQSIRRQLSAKRFESPLFINALQREGSSRGKSKLNMLTKSYMNLKSGKHLEVSYDMQAAHSIRINDYKFMPSSTHHHRTYSNTNTTGFNSTRQLKNLQTNNNPSDYLATKEISDQKSLQKIQSLLPTKKYFKAK